ncbi:uncharacterized protein ACA1_400130 [Acanthamoeba castellanii str. Neff]|uniref:Uncharacterized protein n=1 Tax=Acanthamoeba castellanii (strain ATCC 30010 / Neff) TaxID=1257118 RepID=L8GFT6_ACACF|nr:uncharacterized protein ACA1_400130 [Acanthamoeba castellanii str. Neff]ELR11950.1 hypothetical protein ACA1_400130 [Acanthamoeba castellanii str. Neff]
MATHARLLPRPSPGASAVPTRPHATTFVPRPSVTPITAAATAAAVAPSMQTTTTSTTAPPSEGTEVLSSFLWFHQDRYWNEAAHLLPQVLRLPAKPPTTVTNETEQQEDDAGRNHNANTNDDTQDAHPRISSCNPAGPLLHPVVAHLRFFSRVLASSSFFASTGDIVAFISVFAQLFRELSAPLERASRSASRHVHSGVTQLIIIIIFIIY